MNYIRQHPVLSSLVVNTLLFAALFLFAFPIYRSGDDVFLLYTLSGGYGQPPTELLHYHYGMHPYLGAILKNLFIQHPAFNWYTLLLYMLHFTACTAILSTWVRKNPPVIIACGYPLLFLGIQMHFLLNPTFTNTAFVTAIAGLLLLYHAYRQTEEKNWQLFIGWLMVFIASLLRLHLLMPALLIASPFFLFMTRRHHLARLLRHSIAAVLFIAAFVLVQERYYKKYIPAWEEEETYRQAVIDHYNISKGPHDKQPETIHISADFLEKGILWDKEFLSKEQVLQTTKAIKLRASWQQSDFRQKLYWITIEYRLAILIVALMLLWKFPSFNRKEKTAVVASIALTLVMCMGLFLFMKLPGYAITGALLQLLAFIGLPGKKLLPPAPVWKWLFPLTALLLLSWSIVRVNKLDRRNRHQYGQWKCAYKQIRSRQDKLFIVTDDRFPADFLHVWNTPRRFPMHNILYKDHFLNNTYQSTLQRFGIQSPLQFLHNRSVIFTGVVPVTLLRYYEIRTGDMNGKLRWVETRSCVQTWQLY